MTPALSTSDSPYDPLNPQHVSEPTARLAAARSRCPVSQPRPGVFVVARHHDVLDGLRDPVFLSSADNFVLDGGTEMEALPATPITMLDAPDHTALRARLRRWFAPAVLRQQEPRVRRIVTELLEDLQAGQRVEVWAEWGRPLPARTVYAFLGLPESDWEQVQTWADVVNDHFPQVSTEMPEFAALAGHLGQHLVARAAGPPTGSGVMDGLVHPAPGETPLSPAEGVMHCLQLILAGTDTTGSLITSLLHEVLIDRTRWERLVADPGLVPQAIEESLRHDAPLQYVLRTTTGAGDIGGCPVGEGARVALSLQSANLDEDVWGPDAAVFDLDRPAGSATSATFGHGVHTCLGAPLARLEARLLLEGLLERFPSLRLAPDFVRRPAARSMVRRPARLDVVL